MKGGEGGEIESDGEGVDEDIGEDEGEGEGENVVGVQEMSELTRERRNEQQPEPEPAPEFQMDNLNPVINEHRSLKDDISEALNTNSFLDRGLDPNRNRNRNSRQRQRQRHIQCPHKDRAQIKCWFTYESEISDV